MIDLTAITMDMDPIFMIAGVVVIALSSIWAVRKIIKLANRS